jgi:xyloglucan-specific exo-beta-1,4-glucanase
VNPAAIFQNKKKGVNMKAKNKTPIWQFSLLIILLMNWPKILFSQELEEDYDRFYMDRVLPFDSIPEDAYSDAVVQQWDMREDGFSLSPSVATWSSIGPSNSYNTGRIVRVKYDPDDENVVYVCGHNGGVWRSDNAQANPPSGVVFNFKTMDLQCQSAGDIAIDPQDHNTIYYGTGGNVYGILYNYYGLGVYKSTNKGDNWTGPYNNELPALIYTSAIVVNPNNRHVYLANGWGTGPYGTGQGAGLWKSTNYGVNWAKVVPSGSGIYSDCYDVAVSSTGQFVHVATKSGYWRSTDYGATFTWQDPEGRGFPNINGRTQIDVSQQDPNYVYMVTDQVSGTYNEIHHNYSYVSTDGGATFVNSYDFGTVSFMTVDFFYVKVSPHNKNMAFVGWGGGSIMKRTTNAGANYSSTNVGGIDQNNFAFNPDDENQAIECNDQGVFISNNISTTGGISWTGMNYTLSVRGNYRVATNPYNSNKMVLGVTDAGLYKYVSGVEWTEPSSCCDGTNVVYSRSTTVDAFIGGKGAYNNGLHWSTNAGTNWGYTAITTGYLDGGLDWLYPVAEKPNAVGTFYTPRRNSGTHTQIDINVTTNFGQSWSNNTTNTGVNPIIPVSSQEFSPQWISFCKANPQIIYVTGKRWDNSPNPISRVWRTTNGGGNWTDLSVTANGVPNRVITTVVVDPENESVVYLTLSGFGTAHVYKSVNYGVNWSTISGPGTGALVDLPVNYLVIRHVVLESGIRKELIVGTDAGVYSTTDCEYPCASTYNWKEVAQGLPNTICLGLDYNQFSNKLRAALFGRGVWEMTFPDPIYIAGNQDIASTGDGLNVANDIVITSGSTLTFPQGCTIKMPAGKKIIVESGGHIDISSGAAVTLTSQSGTWGGIEFQGSASGTLKNCTFTNSSTPVVIDGGAYSAPDPPDIVIDSCNFNAPVEISDRDDVSVLKCKFTYTSGTAPSVMGVICSGSNTLISENTITSSSSISSIGISAVYGSSMVIQKNIIHNMTVGISISNTSPLVSQNRITNGTASSSVVGIGLDNSYSASVKNNTVIGYQIGYKLYYSSPTMYMDSSYNTNTSGDSVNGVHAVYISNPRLKPDDTGDELIWDGGKNNLKNINKGNGIFMWMSSTPNIDYGYNFIWGYDNYLLGDGPTGFIHYVRCNDWLDDPPVSGEFNLSNPGAIGYSPYGCTPPGGSGKGNYENIIFNEDPETDSRNMPPPPIVINYGNGVYDTIKVTSGTYEPSADQNLYSDAVKEELLGNYTSAVSKFEDVIENYQDSVSAINSMKKILICHEKMNSDSSAFSGLRLYYQGLAQNNSQDTFFVRAAKELAAKSLVKMDEIEAAITEYEDIVSSSSNSYERYCAELNIIEAYIIMATGEGDAPAFTGRLGYLKPRSKRDGHAMLLGKLYDVNIAGSISHIPKEFSLSQNYPNPFNPLTKINFAVPNTSKVTLKVYDILGKLVKTLVNETKDAGIYNVTFDGSDLASGIYFYKIEAGDFIESKKMVLVK